MIFCGTDGCGIVLRLPAISHRSSREVFRLLSIIADDREGLSGGMFVVSELFVSLKAVNFRHWDISDT